MNQTELARLTIEQTIKAMGYKVDDALIEQWIEDSQAIVWEWQLEDMGETDDDSDSYSI
ncbi:hypothetical protein [Aphanothece hegewaldii]|uniref:hypothetical protein n=1 Tax=Aphanothece hegewaldii TaxID=1521625 RepID=UPI0015E63579|nr:hypothetical protein [Aphanothece hegewaldii]